MTHPAPEDAQVRRWKLVAFVSLALLIGYLVGQLAPRATAQATTSVQLNTSNCRVGSTRRPLENVRDGRIVTAVYVDDRGNLNFIYAFCN